MTTCGMLGRRTILTPDSWSSTTLVAVGLLDAGDIGFSYGKEVEGRNAVRSLMSSVSNQVQRATGTNAFRIGSAVQAALPSCTEPLGLNHSTWQGEAVSRDEQ